MRSDENVLAEDQTATKLRSLLEGLESQSGFRPATARNQQQRLGKIRAEITNLANKEARQLCCCRMVTVAFGNDPEQFDAEMKRPCVIHGRRSLGPILMLTCTPPDSDDLRLMELVRQYSQGRANLASADESRRAI